MPAYVSPLLANLKLTSDLTSHSSICACTHAQIARYSSFAQLVAGDALVLKGAGAVVDHEIVVVGAVELFVVVAVFVAVAAVAAVAPVAAVAVATVDVPAIAVTIAVVCSVCSLVLFISAFLLGVPAVAS
ncbi:hypothetical protein V496_07977 [Pseudogymnoascus sp. VKM F-4515 (FW-2607)]|nr:hypothetical protein V496_07977 [Pseudogymnoascus sp. VKM F-4515 (FW-2607)]